MHARLADFDAQKLSESFVSDGAVLRVRVATSRLDALRALLADVSRGQCSMRVLD
jgi:putative IMPACT (imprinted ancient) family translation regulator